MQLVDWITLGVLVVAALLGLFFGFGKCLKFITGGIVGFLISLVVVYFFLGVISSWIFVQELMAKLHTSMVSANNSFVDFLIKIGIERIILAVATFIIVQIIRILLVSLIQHIVEIDNRVMRIINKFFGMVLMLGVVVMLALIVFQVVAWVGGRSAEGMSNFLTGAFRLEWVFAHNPLNALFQKIGVAAQ